MLKKVWGRVTGGIGRVVGVVCAVVAFVQVAGMKAVMAADVAIPDTGIDWADIGTKAGVALGAVIVGLIGVKIAMAIINAAIRMMSRMFS